MITKPICAFLLFKVQKLEDFKCNPCISDTTCKTDEECVRPSNVTDVTDCTLDNDTVCVSKCFTYDSGGEDIVTQKVCHDSQTCTYNQEINDTVCRYILCYAFHYIFSPTWKLWVAVATHNFQVG